MRRLCIVFVVFAAFCGGKNISSARYFCAGHGTHVYRCDADFFSCAQIDYALCENLSLSSVPVSLPDSADKAHFLLKSVDNYPAGADVNASLAESRRRLSAKTAEIARIYFAAAIKREVSGRWDERVMNIPCVFSQFVNNDASGLSIISGCILERKDFALINLLGRMPLEYKMPFMDGPEVPLEGE